MPSVVEKVVKKYGEGTIYRLGDSSAAFFLSVIPTGSFALDIALGVGGIPRGHITEIYGPEASGKTTISLNVVAQCQAMGGKVAFIDVEHALDIDWASLCGVDTDNLYVSQPQYGEQALDIIEMLLPEFDLIVLDSVASLLPKAELEGEIGDSHMGLQARLMSQAMRKLIGGIKETNTAVIFTNQLRMKIGNMWGSPETTSGGVALGYYASVRLDVRRSETLKDKEIPIGNAVKVTVRKNKVAPPFKVANFDIYYNEGISKTGELANFAIEQGLVEKGGAGWYTFSDGRKVQGMPALRELLKNDVSLMTSIENGIRISYGFPLAE